MFGCAVMVFVGGWLATASWNGVFYVHLIGVITLVCVLVCLPNVKPVAEAKTSGAPAEKGKLTGKMWVWMVVAFFVFCTGQIYSNGNAYLLVEKGIGDSAASGTGMAFFCVGGILMGLVYGKLAQAPEELHHGRRLPADGRFLCGDGLCPEHHRVLYRLPDPRPGHEHRYARTCS